MKHSWPVYTVLAVVLVASTWVSWFLNAEGFLKGLLITPAVVAVIGALYQLTRDEARHLKEVAVQHDQQRFELGAHSYTADGAFEKYVAFCEEYVAELHTTLNTLFRDGEARSALEHANALMNIRRKHSVWLLPAIDAQLDPIDRALRKIGSTVWLQRQHQAGMRQVQEMYDLFANIVGIDRLPAEGAEGTAAKKEIAITTILERTRDILGVR